MPIVPGADGPGSYSIPTGAMDARQSSLDPTAGIQGLQAVAGLGDQISKSEDQTSQTIQNLQQMKDQADVADKVNQYQQAANANYAPGGLFTLQGKNAIDAYPKAMQALEDTRQSLLSSAASPFEREALSASLNDQQTREYRTMDQFYGDQVRNYQDTSFGALADTVSNTAALNYNQPQALQTALDTVTHTATAQAQLRGLNPDATGQFVLQATAKTAAGFIDSAMVNDPGLATAYLSKYRPYLDAATYTELEGRVRQAVLPGAAQDAAGAVLGTTSTQVPQSVMDQISQNESGNQAGLTSPKGAIGPDQIEPATGEQAAKEIGVVWDQQRALNDPVYSRQIATRVMDDNLATFQGSPYQYQAAVAAYNAGPNGAGVQHLAQTGDPSQLPAETQAYLKKFDLSGVQGQTGNAPMSLDQIGANLQGLMQQAGQNLAARFPDQPNAYEMGSQAVYSRYLQMKSAHDDQQSAAQNTVLNAIDAGKITDPSQLLKAGGAVAQSWMALEPDKQAGLLTIMQKNLPGMNDTWTPQKGQAFYTLLGQSVTDPGGFAKINLMDPNVVNSLTHSDLTSLMNKQAAIGKGTSKGLSPQQIDGAMSWVSPMLSSAGINVKNKNDAGHQQFVGAFSQDLQSYADQHDGQMPSAADMNKIAGRLLVQGYSGTGGMFFGASGERLYQAETPAGIDPGFTAKIPAASLSQINAAYQKATGKMPDLKTATAIYLQSMAPGNDSQPGGSQQADAQ